MNKKVKLVDVTLRDGSHAIATASHRSRRSGSHRGLTVRG